MRALIVSDIHSNLEALEAVIADAKARGGFDAVWCLGDSVGYGPDPEACLDLLMSFPLVAVAGNHDRAALDVLRGLGVTPAPLDLPELPWPCWPG